MFEEKISFDKGKTWYRITWDNVSFEDFDNIEGIKECNSIEEFKELFTKAYPNCNLKIK